MNREWHPVQSKRKDISFFLSMSFCLFLSLFFLVLTDDIKPTIAEASYSH